MCSNVAGSAACPSFSARLLPEHALFSLCIAIFRTFSTFPMVLTREVVLNFGILYKQYDPAGV